MDNSAGHVSRMSKETDALPCVAEVGMEADDAAAFRAVFRDAPIGLAVIGSDLRLLDANRVLCLMLGYPADQLIGRSILDVTHPDHHGRDIEHVRAALRGEPRQHGVESRLLKSDRSAVWVEATYTTLEANDRLPVRTVIMFENISVHVRTEDSLRRSERHYRLTFEQAAVGFAHISLDGKWLRFNARLSDILGYSRSEVFDHSVEELLPSDTPEEAELVRKLLRGDAPNFTTEKRVLRKDRTPIWVSVTTSPVRDLSGHAEYLLLAVEDISQRKTVERELERTLRKLEFHIENSPLAVLELDGQLRICRWSGEAERLFGWCASEVLNHGPDQVKLVHPDDSQLLTAMKRRIVDDGADTLVASGRCCNRNGELLHCEWYISALRDAGGRLISVLAQVLDVTARKQFEQAMLENERRFRTLAECMPQIIWTSDSEGNVDYLNQQWTSYTHVPAADCTLEAVRAVLHPDDWRRCLAKWRAAVKSGKPFEIEHRLRRGDDGQYRWHLSRASAVHANDGVIVKWVGTSTDIDDQKRIEELLARNKADIEMLNSRLRRAMKETHHRVKNNLQLIAALVDMRLIEEMQNEATEDLQRLGACIRTLATVHELLTKEAKDEEMDLTLSAEEVLRKLLPLMQQTALGRQLHFQITDARIPLKLGTSLALIANELVSNAFKHGNQNVYARFEVQSNLATLSVTDDGPGFPAEFDPLANANTGLELVENLTKIDLQGDVAYENAPGGGAQVTVRFPIVARVMAH